MTKLATDQQNSPARMLDANNISAITYVRPIMLTCLEASWLNTTQTSNTFGDRNVIRINLRIFTRKFQLKIGWKIRILSHGRKSNSLIIKKKECGRVHFPVLNMAKLLLLAWKNYKLAIQQQGQKLIREENYRKSYYGTITLKKSKWIFYGMTSIAKETYYFQYIIQCHNFHVTLGHL